MCYKIVFCSKKYKLDTTYLANLTTLKTKYLVFTSFQDVFLVHSTCESCYWGYWEPSFTIYIIYLPRVELKPKAFMKGIEIPNCFCL